VPLNLKHFRCRSAQYHFALVGAQAEFLDHLDGTVVTNFKAVVAAKHDSINAYLGDDVLHKWLRMGDDVVGETAQIRAWRLRIMFGRPVYFPTVVETADEVWQHAAGVRECNLELGMAVQHSAEDEMTGSNRRI